MTEIAAQSWPQVESGNWSALIVPLGATEQHGHHLPLNTDTEIASAIALGLAERHPEFALAPALPYGASGEHADFPGTVSIGTEATEFVLVELGRSACATFPRLLFVCAHGGNVDALQGAVTTLRSEGREVFAWVPSWPGDAHAGWTETSLMLAINPSSVQLPAAVEGPTTPIEELLPRLRAEGVRPLSPNGVLGDPADASAEAGRALLSEAIEELISLVRTWGSLE